MAIGEVPMTMIVRVKVSMVALVAKFVCSLSNGSSHVLCILLRSTDSGSRVFPCVTEVLEDGSFMPVGRSSVEPFGAPDVVLCFIEVVMNAATYSPFDSMPCPFVITNGFVKIWFKVVAVFIFDMQRSDADMWRDSVSDIDTDMRCALDISIFCIGVWGDNPDGQARDCDSEESVGAGIHGTSWLVVARACAWNFRRRGCASYSTGIYSLSWFCLVGMASSSARIHRELRTMPSRVPPVSAKSADMLFWREGLGF